MDCNSCPFCNEQFSPRDKTNKLSQKGCKSILRVAQERDCNITDSPAQRVHVKCRQQFINAKSIECSKRKSLDDEETHKRVKLRSDEPNSSFRDQCLFCGCGDIYNGKERESKLIAVRSPVGWDFNRCTCY